MYNIYIPLFIHYSEQFSTTPSGTIISSQVSKEFIQLPENGSVLLKFNNVRM